jgi:hypothetical protein
VPLQQQVHVVEQLLHVEGLADVLVGALLESFDRLLNGGIGGDQDDGCVGAVFLAVLQEIHAGAAWEANVGDDQGKAPEG